MYVCICKGITEKQLQEAITARKGQSTKYILKSLNIGSDCGTCVQDAIHKLLQNSSQSPRSSKDSPPPRSN